MVNNETLITRNELLVSICDRFTYNPEINKMPGYSFTYGIIFLKFPTTTVNKQIYFRNNLEFSIFFA
jgi:hypothetical protein